MGAGLWRSYCCFCRLSFRQAPLTHDETVRLALERAPSIQAQGLAIEGAESSVTAAGRLPDPELIVGVDNLPVDGPDAYSLNRDFMTMRKVGVISPSLVSASGPHNENAPALRCRWHRAGVCNCARKSPELLRTPGS